MAKMNDYMAGRQDGLQLALTIVEKNGVDGLRDEIEFRNATQIHTMLDRKSRRTAPPEQEQAKKELEEETVDPGDNSDRHLCMTCKYRGKKRPGRPKKDGAAARPGCNYYVITDRERGCDVEKCDKWEAVE